MARRGGGFGGLYKGLSRGGRGGIGGTFFRTAGRGRGAPGLSGLSNIAGAIKGGINFANRLDKAFGNTGWGSSAVRGPEIKMARQIFNTKMSEYLDRD